MKTIYPSLQWLWLERVEMDVTSIYSWFEKGCPCKDEFETLVNVISDYYYILMFRPYTKTFDICSWFPSFLLLSLCPSLQATLLPAKATHHLEFVILCCFRYIVLQCNWKKKTWLLFFTRKRIRVFRVNLLKLPKGRSFPRFPKRLF